MAMTQKSNIKTPVRHLLRQLASYTDPVKGWQSVHDVDQELGSLIMQGYRIVGTHFTGARRDSDVGTEYYGVLYILQLEQSEIERLKKAELVEKAG